MLNNPDLLTHLFKGDEFWYPIKLVDHVIDGDTTEVVIDLGFSLRRNVQIRMNGLDCPEKTTPEGQKVKDIVTALLARQGKLILQSMELLTDKYGRVMGDIWYMQGGLPTSLAQYLLGNGLARVYKGEKKLPWTADQINTILKFPAPAPK